MVSKYNSTLFLEGWIGSVEGRLKREEIHVCVQLTCVVIQQKPTQHCNYLPIKKSEKENPIVSHSVNVLYIIYSVIFLCTFRLFLGLCTTNSRAPDILLHVPLFADALISAE